MSPPMPSSRHDAIVIGAGLAGLCAAVELARAGCRPLVVERRATAGGKCGTVDLDGHRFTVGCNDFGAGVERDLRALGVDVRFAASTSTAAIGDAVYRTPPDLRTLVRLARRLPAIVRLVRAVRARRRPWLADVLAEDVRDARVTGLVSMLGYATGTPLEAMATEALAADFSKRWAYGHDRMKVPVGGVEAIVDGLVGRLRALGGELRTGVRCSDIHRDGADRVVVTGDGELRAPLVLASERDPAAGGRAGLSAIQLLLAVRPGFRWPRSRALVVLPGDPAWLTELDRGALPEPFGFHLFRDHAGPSGTTIVGYALAPRGVTVMAPELRARVERTILDGAERFVPGLERALVFRRLLDPDDYRRLHGLDSALGAIAASPAAAPAPSLDDVRGVHRIGNGFEAPGEHAGAAIRSGL
ncbi:MAG TPA: FAD-dependent oxidoreductase, partial [Kofleriaceae bacterium]|nr:FAD-dependent oxidoreductase [Kofleriaceae bacterium]